MSHEPTHRGFVGSQCYLRPLETPDLESRVRWINDPETRSLLMFDYPTSLAKTQKWFANTLFDSSKWNMSIVDVESGDLVGMTGLLDINHVHRRGQFYITIGEERFRGRGLASEVIPMNLHYAFSELELNRVYLYTLPNNERARAVYEKHGFQNDGMLRSHYRCAGAIQDIYVHSILREEWLAL